MFQDISRVDPFNLVEKLHLYAELIRILFYILADLYTSLNHDRKNLLT